MCGIIGVHTINNSEDVIYIIFEGLLGLQHRGQDGVGIATSKRIIKKNGLVKTSYVDSELLELKSNCCIGHVRYATNGVIDGLQPFYSNFPRRITICHNGNIINIQYLKNILESEYNILTSSESDSYIFLCIFSSKLYSLLKQSKTNTITSEMIFTTTNYIHSIVEGSFCVNIIIEGYGMISIRDRCGIRPLIWGMKNKNINLVCSESTVLNILDFEIIRDVNSGETIIFEDSGHIKNHHFEYSVLTPCLFEYIYFARSDSILDNINVLDARISIGQIMGKHIMNNINEVIDVIVPVPDTSITFANGIQDILKIPIRNGLIKNRYIDRTFIMKDQTTIIKNIKRKITCNDLVFRNKNVLIVDDSIVRGNTSKHIINIVKKCNPRKIIFVSCSPVIKNTNNFGIYIPTKEELIYYDSRSIEDIRKYLGVDYLFYNDLDDIVNELLKKNKKIDGFEISMFKD